jgi:DNA-binding GntR family transcriptional regulator
MELIPVDTQRAYNLIREKIITLELAPGTPVSEEQLSKELGAGPGPVREAIKLLAHDQLIDLSTGGINVAPVDIPDLEQISEIRILSESFSARQAARQATPDDLVVLEALCREQAAIPPGEYRRLLDLDHKFHQAIAQAARNKYLTQTLDHLFGLSQRLWYLALPRLDFLPAAVGKHLELAAAIKSGDADKAEHVMRDHVQGFYDRVKEVLK